MTNLVYHMFNPHAPEPKPEKIALENSTRTKDCWQRVEVLGLRFRSTTTAPVRRPGNQAVDGETGWDKLPPTVDGESDFNICPNVSTETKLQPYTGSWGTREKV